MYFIVHLVIEGTVRKMSADLIILKVFQLQDNKNKKAVKTNVFTAFL